VLEREGRKKGGEIRKGKREERREWKEGGKEDKEREGRKEIHRKLVLS
jgi:hypothetical protein